MERMNSLDCGPTEEERKVECAAGIERTIAAEGELKWGRISAGGVFGLSGPAPDPKSKRHRRRFWRQ